MTEKTLKLLELIRDYTYLAEGSPDENDVRHSELTTNEPDKFYEAVEVFILENEKKENYKKRKLEQFSEAIRLMGEMKILPETIARKFRSEIEALKNL